jgi:predicted PurR-regulated permease PerM
MKNRGYKKDMWYEKKFFKYCTAVILVMLIIFLLGKIDFFLEPLKKFIAILFFPILIAGVLYYLFRPLVNLLEKIRIPRTIGIIVSFLAVLVLAVLISTVAGSFVVKQVNQLINEIPGFIVSAGRIIEDIIEKTSPSFISADNISQQFTSFFQNAVPFISQSIISGISAVTGIAIVLLVVPFILFYFLKDDKLFVGYFQRIIPSGYKDEGKEILEGVDKTLAVYITGEFLIAVAGGVLIYVGYLIIGLEYSLILAIFVMITSIIPVIGTFIGILPALIVGLATDPIMVVKILIIMIIVQQIQGNVLAPQLMGKQLNIHPLTIILLLLASGALYGFIGILLAIPVYAIVKIIGKSVYKLYKLHKGL